MAIATAFVFICAVPPTTLSCAALLVGGTSLPVGLEFFASAQPHPGNAGIAIFRLAAMAVLSAFAALGTQAHAAAAGTNLRANTGGASLLLFDTAIYLGRQALAAKLAILTPAILSAFVPVPAEPRQAVPRFTHVALGADLTVLQQ